MDILQRVFILETSENLEYPPPYIVKGHKWRRLPGMVKKGRKYCRGCYKKKRLGLIVKSKIRKVITYCETCPGSPRYCLDCFKKEHSDLEVILL